MKVGWINFLNTLPFDFEKVGIKPDIDIQIIKDYPAVLNKLLKEGKIDIGIISSAEYIENYKDYLILPDLSISSYKDVKSVSILSNTALEDIKELYLTKASKSSVLLTKIIFKEFLKKDVIYHSLENWENLEEKSVLFIGDAAILFKDKFKYVYDLSYLWYKYTKMPFTFALWCVRKDFYKNHLKEVLLFHKLLIQTKERFFNDIDKYLDNINFDKDFAKEYLLNLDYNLEKKHIESLKKFSEYLLKNEFIKEIPEFRFTDKLIITNTLSEKLNSKGSIYTS
ncbi:menaquinone biosynthesis protein [Venenivibrio stagnispumantis]|nr:menaquinone biosynthesis protein [Venenivibrio stagnispumantis]